MGMLLQKHKKVFVSHATKDVEYVKIIVDLLEDIGLTENQVVCSSVPGYGIPLGEDIYEWLAKQFREFDLHVLFVLSDNYYSSVACQNEMGAAWVLKTKYDAVLLPGFEFQDIKGAVNPNQISMKLDGDEAILKQHLNELKDTLVTEFGLHMPSASKWERNRKSFLDAISVEMKNNPTEQEESVPVEKRSILTKDAAEMLVSAVNDPSGQIRFIKTIAGTFISSNEKAFAHPDGGPRAEARWVGALEELESRGFVKATSYKRSIFTVTREGYAYADSIRESGKSPTEV